MGNFINFSLGISILNDFASFPASKYFSFGEENSKGG